MISQIVFTEKLFTSTTPKTIKNNPNTACQDKVCLKTTYPNIAIALIKSRYV